MTVETLRKHVSLIINYNRKSRQDEDLEKRTGEDTLKSMRELMDRTLSPIGIPYTQLDEIGSGDKISTRPVFQGILEELREGKYQAIAVKEISRMGRGSYTDMGVIYDLIVEKRLFIITPYRIYDPKNPADLRQIRFELFMSREEFETTSERLAGGRVTSAMDGKWVAGTPPYGFDVSETTGRLIPNEEEAKIVNTIFNLFVNGIPDENGELRLVRFRALGTYLSSIGIKNPDGNMDWQPDRLERLITNPAYVGILAYMTTMTVNGKVLPRPREEHIIVPYAHPAIVDLDLWIEAQKLVEDKSYKPKLRTDCRPYPLTGLIVCAKCKRRMIRRIQKQKYVSRKTGEVKIHHKEFLVCALRGCQMVVYKYVEESVLEALETLSNLDDKGIYDVLTDVVKQKNDSQTSEDPLQFILRRKKELKNRLDFIIEKHMSGVYDDEMFLEQKQIIDKELERLNNSMAGLSNQKKREPLLEIDADAVRKRAASVLKSYYDETDRENKNKILRNVFEKIDLIITEKGRGSTPSKFEILTKIKHDFLLREN